ncbi:HNH endonuclease [Corynebacterium choanae]|nr:HNH endonuclease signature motif containing protein [Corynebacterium choanae]
MTDRYQRLLTASDSILLVELAKWSATEQFAHATGLLIIGIMAIRGIQFHGGRRDMVKFLEETYGLTKATAARRIRYGRFLVEHPNTYQAMLNGTIRADHLPTMIAYIDTITEPVLLSFATRMNAKTFRKTVQRLAHPDPKEKVETDYWIAMDTDDTGAVTIKGVLDPILGAQLQAVLKHTEPLIKAKHNRLKQLRKTTTQQRARYSKKRATTSEITDRSSAAENTTTTQTVTLDSAKQDATDINPASTTSDQAAVSPVFAEVIEEIEAIRQREGLTNLRSTHFSSHGPIHPRLTYAAFSVVVRALIGTHWENQPTKTPGATVTAILHNTADVTPENSEGKVDSAAAGETKQADSQQSENVARFSVKKRQRNGRRSRKNQGDTDRWTLALPDRQQSGVTLSLPHQRYLDPDHQAHLLANADAFTVISVDNKGEVLNYGRAHRLARTKQVNALLALYNHTCAVPLCHNTRNLEFHHIVPWSKGGRTDIDNLIPLCAGCHAEVTQQLLTITPINNNTMLQFLFGTCQEIIITDRKHPKLNWQKTPAQSPVLPPVVTSLPDGLIDTADQVFCTRNASRMIPVWYLADSNYIPAQAAHLGKELAARTSSNTDNENAVNDSISELAEANAGQDGGVSVIRSTTADGTTVVSLETHDHTRRDTLTPAVMFDTPKSTAVFPLSVVNQLAASTEPQFRVLAHAMVQTNARYHGVLQLTDPKIRLTSEITAVDLNTPTREPSYLFTRNTSATLDTNARQSLNTDSAESDFIPKMVFPRASWQGAASLQVHRYTRHLPPVLSVTPEPIADVPKSALYPPRPVFRRRGRNTCDKAVANFAVPSTAILARIHAKGDVPCSEAPSWHVHSERADQMHTAFWYTNTVQWRNPGTAIQQLACRKPLIDNTVNFHARSSTPSTLWAAGTNSTITETTRAAQTTGGTTGSALGTTHAVTTPAPTIKFPDLAALFTRYATLVPSSSYCSMLENKPRNCVADQQLIADTVMLQQLGIAIGMIEPWREQRIDQMPHDLIGEYFIELRLRICRFITAQLAFYDVKINPESNAMVWVYAPLYELERPSVEIPGDSAIDLDALCDEDVDDDSASMPHSSSYSPTAASVPATDEITNDNDQQWLSLRKLLGICEHPITVWGEYWQHSGDLAAAIAEVIGDIHGTDLLRMPISTDTGTTNLPQKQGQQTMFENLNPDSAGRGRTRDEGDDSNHNPGKGQDGVVDDHEDTPPRQRQ